MVICDYCQHLLKGKNQNITVDEMKYISPEMLEDKNIGISSDIWSLGCVIYFIKTGNNMFDYSNKNELIKKIRNCEYEKLKDNIIDELLEHIIVYDEDKRYSISDINNYLKENKIITSDNTMAYLPKSQNDDDIDSLVGVYCVTDDKDLLKIIVKRCINEELYFKSNDEIANTLMLSFPNKNELVIKDKLLASDMLKEISNNINVYENIEVLKIESTLDESDIRLVSEIIPQLENLNTLSLNGVSPINTLFFTINTELPKLLSLDLSSNNFTLKSSIELKNSLKYLLNLKWLYLKNVTVCEDVIYPIIEVIPELKDLKTLDISGNTISEIEIEEIDELIRYNPLLYVITFDKAQKLKKETEWDVIHDSESNITKVTKRIKHLSSSKTLSSKLEPFAKSLNTLVIDLSNITDECLKEIAEIPTTYVRVKKIHFSHLYTQHYFTSDGLKVLLPLLSSEIITLETFIAYFVNDKNTFRDWNYYINLKEMMSKYKELDDIYNKYESIGEISIDGRKSSISFDILSSFPPIDVLYIKNIAFESGNGYEILLTLNNIGYIEVENISLGKTELEMFLDLIEKGIMSPDLIKEYSKKCKDEDSIEYVKNICKQILSKEDTISDELKKSMKNIMKDLRKKIKVENKNEESKCKITDEEVREILIRNYINRKRG